ncbi:hypothetical protein MLD52_01205 [Puniceicoccaceae bacterium K14]|nr:hypothetical protein [Puniceicoccaceae bacterium K14]
MIKFLIKIAIVGIIALLGYNFFLGTDEEKEQAKAVFKQVGDLGKSIGSFVMSEKEKFGDGKYGDALDGIGEVIDNLKQKATNAGEGATKQLEALKQEKASLEAQYEKVKDSASDEEIKVLYDKMKGLYKKTEDLTNSLVEEE